MCQLLTLGKPIICKDFMLRKLHENERNWTEGGISLIFLFMCNTPVGEYLAVKLDGILCLRNRFTFNRQEETETGLYYIR